MFGVLESCVFKFSLFLSGTLEIPLQRKTLLFSLKSLSPGRPGKVRRRRRAFGRGGKESSHHRRRRLRVSFFCPPAASEKRRCLFSLFCREGFEGVFSTLSSGETSQIFDLFSRIDQPSIGNVARRRLASRERERKRYGEKKTKRERNKTASARAGRDFGFQKHSKRRGLFLKRRRKQRPKTHGARHAERLRYHQYQV